MGSAVERTVDVIILLGSTVYTITALSGVSAMWILRKQFFIAVRSPLLGCLIGAIHTIRSIFAAYYFVPLQYWSSKDGYSAITACFNIVSMPASLVALTATIAWAVRLLVMYDPMKRRKWGRYTNEKRIFHGLIWTYVLIEVTIWASACVFGLQRINSKIWVIDTVGVLATLAAAVLLTGKLRRVHDICQLSSDTRHIGAIMIFTLVAAMGAFSIPMPRTLQKYMMVAVAISPQPIAWIVNIRPVRDYLRQRAPHDGRTGDLLLVLLFPWCRSKPTIPANSGRVACTINDRDRPSATRSEFRSSRYERVHGSQLAAIMEFVPLKQAFEQYCRKALCSESLQFLVEVSEFRRLVRGAHLAGEESGKDDFEEFTAIVNEYIKDNSISEINIDSTTKKSILRLCERSAYSSLVLGDRENVFSLAEREIDKMLSENLLNRFKATTEYKEIIGDTFYDETAAK